MKKLLVISSLVLLTGSMFAGTAVQAQEVTQKEKAPIIKEINKTTKEVTFRNQNQKATYRVSFDGRTLIVSGIDNSFYQSMDTYSTSNYVGYGYKTSGGQVKAAQILLNIAPGGSYIDEDGLFGPKTQERIKGFQRSYGLSADGIVGRDTWRKLYYAI